MTEKLYYQSPYLEEAEACVVSVSGNEVILDRTIFYPEAGGQPGDRGWIGDIRVTDTRKADNGDVIHIVDKSPELGKRYHIKLDWAHRYHYMREHSAQHLLSALLYHIKDIGTVAVHQGESFITIETDRAEIDEKDLLEVEEAAVKAVNRGLRIWQETVSHEEAEALNMRRSIKVSGDVMLVHIEDTDVVACGGVHLASTSEIEEICYAGSEKIRSHVRTIWKCGPDAREYRRTNRSLVKSFSSLLSSDAENLVPSLEKVLSESADKSRTMKNLEERIAGYEYREAFQKAGPVAFVSSVPVSSYEKTVNYDGRTVLVADENGRFILFSSEPVFTALKATGLKGGGRAPMFRGSFSGSAHDFIKNALEVIE